MGTNFGILLSFNICTSLLENSGLITFEEVGCCSGSCNWRRRRFRLKRKITLHFVKEKYIIKKNYWLIDDPIYLSHRGRVSSFPEHSSGFKLFYKEGDYYLLLHVDNSYFRTIKTYWSGIWWWDRKHYWIAQMLRCFGFELPSLIASQF